MRKTLALVAVAAPMALAMGVGTAQALPAKKAASVKQLIKPKKDYLGFYSEAYGHSPGAQAKAYKKKVGKKPNIQKRFATFQEPFNASWARKTWNTGALPQISWEPHGESLQGIASGARDEYIRQYARDVRALNVPVSISFGHEMNGWWYSWGVPKNTAHEPVGQQFVAAWKRIHDIFRSQRAGNVIWLWAPNVIWPMPKIKLKAFYPGDAYVDWVGINGYYKAARYSTWKSLFEPTIKQVRTFSGKPILLAEVGSKPTKRKPTDITEMLTQVRKRKDLIGLIYFDMYKSSNPTEFDYRIGTPKASLKAFKAGVKHKSFGFDVRKP